MLEIKTISNQRKADFDEEVNAALREGWELVRRDLLILGADRSPYLYAELEREVEPEEEPEDDGTAEWELVRDPAYPFRCSKCSCKSDEVRKTCPVCGRRMTGVL